MDAMKPEVRWSTIRPSDQLRAGTLARLDGGCGHAWAVVVRGPDTGKGKNTRPGELALACAACGRPWEAPDLAVLLAKVEELPTRWPAIAAANEAAREAERRAPEEKLADALSEVAAVEAELEAAEASA